MSNELAKVGGEALGFMAAELKENENHLLQLFDGAVEQGTDSAETAFLSAIKTKGGIAGALAGGSVSGIIKAAAEGIDHAVEGAAKTMFDKVIAALEAKAAELEA